MDMVLARAVMALHLGFLAYVVLGGIVAWWWPRSLPVHVAAVLWGLASVGLGLPCPLTWLEETFRARAGLAPLRAGGFIDTYVEGVLYPERYTPLVVTAVALWVVASWARLALRVAPGA